MEFFKGVSRGKQVIKRNEIIKHKDIILLQFDINESVFSAEVSMMSYNFFPRIQTGEKTIPACAAMLVPRVVSHYRYGCFWGICIFWGYVVSLSLSVSISL